MPFSSLGGFVKSIPKLSRFPKPRPIEWVCLAIGLFLCFRYEWILDDAYVYFRYVDNLVALNIGLVNNRGEYVEGFSSPAWAMALTMFRLLHLNYWTIIRLVAVVTLVTVWALLVVINRKLSDDADKSLIVNFPLIHLTLTYGVLCYFTSGMETPLVQLCGVAYACFLLYPSSLPLQFLLGLSPLIRHELAIPFVIIIVWTLVSQKKIPWLLALTGLIGGTSWLIFRIYYYADLFPNTFYLKDEFALRQGWLYIKDSAIPYASHYIMALAVLCLVALRFWNKKGARFYFAERAGMLLIGLSVLAYVVKIGGDGRHYRYLAFPYTVMMCATGGLLEGVLANLKFQRYPRLVFTLGIAIALFTLTRYPQQLYKHPFFYDEMNRPVNQINDAAPHRLNSLVSTECSETDLVRSKRESRQLYEETIDQNVTAGHICATAYRLFNYQFIHDLGLTEPFLARTNMKSDRPGHKYGFLPLGADILSIRKKYGFGSGAFRKAVETGEAPEWVKKNLATIEKIELKAYNRHNFLENLGLALTSTGRIEPDGNDGNVNASYDCSLASAFISANCIRIPLLRRAQSNKFDPTESWDGITISTAVWFRLDRQHGRTNVI